MITGNCPSVKQKTSFAEFGGAQQSDEKGRREKAVGVRTSNQSLHGVSDEELLEHGLVLFSLPNQLSVHLVAGRNYDQCRMTEC